MIEKPTKEELRYWEQVLHDHRLGKDRGRSSKVDCVGGQDDLAGVERARISKRIGRSGKSKGAKPE
jgi:hypothetical protein